MNVNVFRGIFWKKRKGGRYGEPRYFAGQIPASAQSRVASLNEFWLSRKVAMLRWVNSAFCAKSRCFAGQILVFAQSRVPLLGKQIVPFTTGKSY